MTQSYHAETELTAKVKEENPLVKNMRENFGFFCGCSVLYGIIFVFCLYKNLNGITFPVYVAATIAVLVLFLKRSERVLKKKIWIYFAGMILLGISSCLTTNVFFLFFNWVGILLLLATAILYQFFDEEQKSFGTYIKKIFSLLGHVIVSISTPFDHAFSYVKKSEDGRKKNVFAAMAGIAIAFGFLVVVFPLLIQSDKVFSNFVIDFFDKIQIGNIFGVSFTALFGMISIYALFSGACSMEYGKEKEKNKPEANSVIGITFSLAVTLIYLIYCGIQMVYLFFRLGGGLPGNLTYSQYAHEGFWQLLIVSLINFIAVLCCLAIFKKNKVLDILLTIFSGCTFIMIFSAAYRMILYVKVYYLTFLRVMVLWFLLVLTFIMIGVVISIYQKKFILFPYIVMVVSCAYILLSFSRPDYQIAKYNVSQGNLKVEDVTYLLYECSYDAAPVVADIDINEISDFEKFYWTKEDLEWEIEQYFSYIEREYEEMSFREWNYSKYSALKAK